MDGSVHGELERARTTFADLVRLASEEDLRAPSAGTRWTNRQLLFHMVLGFLIIRALRTLVRVFGRLPDGASRRFAAALNTCTPVFDRVNFVGSWAGGQTLSPLQMAHLLDRTVMKLHKRLDSESKADLARGMHYPTRWDPFFRDYMTVADIYRFSTQHFEFHRRQLTLGPTATDLQ